MMRKLLSVTFLLTKDLIALDTKLDIESAEAEDDLQNNEIIVPLRSPLSVTIYQTPVVSICKV